MASSFGVRAGSEVSRESSFGCTDSCLGGRWGWSQRDQRQSQVRTRVSLKLSGRHCPLGGTGLGPEGWSRSPEGAGLL